MKDLVGCEESGKIRDAFLRRGHDAWSNDLIPARNGGPHLQMDVFDAIDQPRLLGYSGWDIIIVHPECTSVCLAGNKTYAGTLDRELQKNWIVALWAEAKKAAKIGCALENPASVIWPHLRKTSDAVQFVQPWWFGHMEKKKTGFALYGLPPLEATNDVYEEMMKLRKAERERIFYMAPGPNRSRDRSETYSGLAEAIAEQWGAYGEGQSIQI